MWPEVTKFLNLVKPGSLIADIGCGNGKYLDYRVNDCTIFACDISEELLKISKLKRNPKINYTQGSVLNLPYRDNLFDAIIHIAVLHHISTKERRIIAIKELIRCCCIGGRICITVWADEQIKKEKWKLCNTNNSNTDYMIPFDKRNGQVVMRYYHLFTESDFRSLLEELSDLVIIERFIYDKDNWIAILKKL
jgi:ubiquinone/menaquinone biosynthesis C-methylase UbiE